VPVPPAPTAVAVPFDPPLQLGLVPVTEAVTAVGLVNVTFPVAVQLLPSVTVAV